MSDTPRTDAVVIHPSRPVTEEYSTLETFARELERDLYATQEAYVSAHSDRNKYRDAMLDLASGLRMIGAELHPDIAELVDSALRIYGFPENLSKQETAAFKYVAKDDRSDSDLPNV